MSDLSACRDNVFLLVCGSIKLWEDTESVKKVQDLLSYSDSRKYYGSIYISEPLSFKWDYQTSASHHLAFLIYLLRTACDRICKYSESVNKIL
ncbi:hypothetical protein CIPAW_03G248200 [Carya illinoinensis]|uniref:Uncharacterized protein n=1 Tax=Carya illinoinensis TaxID=32201 RepID=A0A8T1R806_CARIL|nr:hypothetical protein CIPAW_03G248200 [Carya illinoinensis]